MESDLGDRNGMLHRTARVGLAAAVMMMAAVCVFHVVAFFGLPGDYRFSNLAWQLASAALAFSAVAALQLTKHASSRVLHLLAFLGTLTAGVLTALMNGPRPGPLACAAVALVASALMGHSYSTERRFLRWVPITAAVTLGVLFGCAALSSTFFKNEVEKLPPVVSPDGAHTATVTVVLEGAWGSNWGELVVYPEGPHLLEYYLYLEGSDVGVQASWVSADRVRVGDREVEIRP